LTDSEIENVEAIEAAVEAVIEARKVIVQLET